MENFVNTTVYLPLLRQFCDSTLPLYRCGYPYGPFIPHVFPRYGAAPLKIFYVGRDTYYWVPNSHPNGFLRCVEERRLGDYLRESANTVRMGQQRRFFLDVGGETSNLSAHR